MGYSDRFEVTRAQGDGRSVELVLMGIRAGAPDYAEEVITNRPERFDAAREWAKGQGFDRFRVMEVDLSVAPDFAKAVGK